MTLTQRITLRLSAAAAACASAGVLGVAPAQATGAIPFADPNATATIGFCDRAGHEMTSGRIGDAPFAWTAVSSAPAPAGYAPPSGHASLFVYQPIKYVDPGDWSGKQMTAGSTFTNAAHPMARGTVIDPALVDFTSVFPPHWDGIVQMRMFFTAPDMPQVTSTYPAAVLKVQGDTWTLLSGGHPACKAGNAVSAETRDLPKSVFENATPRATPGATAKAGASPSGHASGSSGSGRTPAAAGASAPAAGAVGAASASRHSSGSSGWWWFATAVALVAAGGAGAVWRFRRSS